MPIPEYGVALTAFVIFEAAYFGEIVRAGVQSVPRGQVEAATALGLTATQDDALRGAAAGAQEHGARRWSRR